MERPCTSERSIFDLAEEQGSEPETFAWHITPPMRLNDLDCLFRGALHTFYQPANCDTVHHYALTLDGLYRSLNECAEDSEDLRTETQYGAFLKFKNPRLLKAKTEQNARCGFRLLGLKGVFEFYCPGPLEFSLWMEQLRKVCVGSEVSANYTIGKLIGRGSTAQVRLVSRNVDGAKFALKTFESHKLQAKPSTLGFLTRELDILRRINHPSIIKLYEVYEDKLYVHMVFEYLEGGDLLSHLAHKGVYSEKDASMVTRKVLEALAYCHTHNVIHRDLKPENLIMVDSKNDYDVKIADFGLGTFTSPGAVETVRCGSPGYVAPEVLLRLGYNTKVDIFSAGVILFCILTGTSPFPGSDPIEVLTKNKECKVMFNEFLWSRVSPEARDLVTRMLAKDPKERISARDALAHPWFMLENTGSSLLDTAQENMRKHCNESCFNVTRIKPEFSILTISPLLHSRYANIKDSPLILPSTRNLALSPLFSPRTGPNTCREEIKAKSTAGLYQIRNIKERNNAPPDKKFKTTVVHKISIPDTEDDAADFNERDIAEKGTDCTRDTQYRGADGPCAPRMFLGRGTVRCKRYASTRRSTAVPTTPPIKRIAIKTGGGPDNTENSAPTAGISSRLERNRGFAESEDENTFQTAIETLANNTPLRAGVRPILVRPPIARVFQATIREEDESGVFLTAKCDEDEASVNNLPTQPHQVPKIAPRVAQGMGISRVARPQSETGCIKMIPIPQTARQPMVPLLKTKKQGK